MKLIFICGCLQPGNDGVGDYTRRLAAALKVHGHDVYIIALNDRFIDENRYEEQAVDGITVSTLRLSFVQSYKIRFAEACQCVKLYNPDWLSLQYVPFGFSNKGLPTGFTKHLCQLTNGAKWHLMLHELWVGMEDTATAKLRVWGLGQKLLIKNMINSLKPASIHTQSKLYQAQMGKLGYTVDYLPLFSNIRNVYKNSSPYSAPHTPPNRARNITLVMFGTIHPTSPIEQFAADVAEYAQKNTLTVQLVIIGRSGDEQNKWAKIWADHGMGVKLMGEQTEAAISQMLLESSIGLTTTVGAKVEKSGSVAAMFAHGLPVLCVAGPWRAKGIRDFSLPEGVFEYKKGNIDQCLRLEHNWGFVKDVPEVAALMLKSLV